MLTQEEYVVDGGSHCPKCGSENIDAAPVEFSGNQIYQDVDCYDCGFKWFDFYELKGYEEFEPEDKTEW